MIEGRDTLKLGLIRRVSKGDTINIWNTNWLPRKENMRPIVARVNDPPQLVSDLIDQGNARWDTELIEQVFLLYDAAAILSIPLCTRIMEDFWSWGFEKNGIFSVRSAYKMLVETKKRRED